MRSSLVIRVAASVAPFIAMRREAISDASDSSIASKMTVYARLAETVLLQIEQGLLPPDAMERLGYRGWAGILESQKRACVWPLIRPGVSTSFREYVEGAQEPSTIDCSGFDIPSWF